MILSNDEKESTDNYTIDVKNTLISNSVFFAFALVHVVFLVKAFNMIAQLPDDMKVLALIVFLFAFTKISAGWSNFNLEYKPRQ